MLINRQQLCDLIPHEGGMCLLDSVESWSEEQIICASSTHHKKDNPLTDGKRLDCVNAIEYGAQAVAIHGGLLAKQKNGEIPRSGFLVQVKALEFVDCDLSALPGALNILARKLHFEKSSMLYTINIKHNHHQLMQGRIMIFISE